MWKLSTLPLLILLLALFVLSGCTGSGGLIPVTDTMVTETGDVVEKVAGYTHDASVAKEHEVHETLRNRDAMIAKAQKTSGFKLEWKPVKKTVFYPGMAQPVVVEEPMPEVSYAEPADFSQPLPTEPSRHPAWKTAEVLGGKLIDSTTDAIKVVKVLDVMGEMADNTGDKYNGDVVNNQSGNQGDGIGPVSTENILPAVESSEGAGQ